MYAQLPRPLHSRSGFQGCLSSFETNGELLDPVKHALVPSPIVEEGCEGKPRDLLRIVVADLTRYSRRRKRPSARFLPGSRVALA